MPDLDNLHPGFRKIVLAMCEEAGVAPEIAIVSAYRDSAKQAQLYKCYVAKLNTGRCKCTSCNPANPPGKSQHEKGEAVDWAQFVVPTMHRLAPKYGCYFPIRGENWHMERYAKGTGGAGPQIPKTRWCDVDTHEYKGDNPNGVAVAIGTYEVEATGKNLVHRSWVKLTGTGEVEFEMRKGVDGAPYAGDAEIPKWKIKAEGEKTPADSLFKRTASGTKGNFDGKLKWKVLSGDPTIQLERTVMAV